nr:MAG TPA: Reaction center protein H chain, membrane protein, PHOTOSYNTHESIS [Caudoviricetes sp.]
MWLYRRPNLYSLWSFKLFFNALITYLGSIEYLSLYTA